MSKDQSDTHLRFGQGVIIKGYKSQDGEGEGIMTVRGFADVRANYETFSDILYFKNYRNGIFQFLPAGNFEINDQLYKIKSKIIQSQAQRLQIAKTVQTLQARAKSEQTQFQLSIKRNQKSTIKFGDYIMLRHVDSQTYLSGTIRPSDGTNGAFSVEVSNRLSSALIFQVLPYRSFEAQSMQIPFSSPVLIKNIYNNGYLTFEKYGIVQDKSRQNDFMRKVPTSSDESYKIPVKTATQNSNIYQVVTHFVDLSINSKDQIPMPWIFQMHFNQVDNDSLIQHDIVYLQHTDNNGILSAIGVDIVLKQSKSGHPDGLQYYQSLWEIQKYKGQSTYILRHLMSGMTLGVKTRLDEQQNKQVPESAILMDISKGDPENTELGCVDLLSAKKDGGQINSQSFVYILAGEYTLDITDQQNELEEDLRQSKANHNSQQIINLKMMKRLMKNELEYNARKLKFTPQISKNCFVIQQIQPDLKKQLLFALSFHSTMINLREDLKWGATDAMKKVNYLRMMKVTQKITEINDFLKDCSSNDPDKQFKQPIYKRQMICKDLGLSELLFQLLFYIKQNIKQEIFKEKINERQKFYEMHVTIYQVIINLVKNNKSFKIHVSKWMMFVFQDFVQKGQDIHYQALLQILKDNEFFLQNFVNKGLLQYLFKSMLKQRFNRSFREKRYIDVLRAFCMVGEKVYSSNQGLILKYFIEKLRQTPQGIGYQIQFYQKKDNIYCKIALDKKKLMQYKFEDFKSICQQLDSNEIQLYPNSWNYYTAYLNLLADITKGRNKAVEKYVANQLPLPLLAELYISYSLGQLEVPIVKIIHYLYFQNQFFYPIDKQNRIVSYESIQNQKIEQINHFTGPQPPGEHMQKILIKLQQKLYEAGTIGTELIQQKSKNSSTDHTQTQILIQLLKMTRQTLNLGFWLIRQDLQKIFMSVLRILDKHRLVNYQQAKKISKQNELMISFKIECLNIIDMILDQDMSTSLKICNKAFKQFQLPSSNEADKQPKSLTFQQNNYQYAKSFIDSIQQSSKQIEPIVDSKIYKQMVQLSRYNNSTLTSKSLAILHRILDFKKHRISKFYAELFVCEQNCVQFAQFLTNMKNKFFILDDINTTKVSLQKQKQQNYIGIYAPLQGPYVPDQKYEIKTTLMHDLYIISELMKNEYSLAKIQEIPTLDSSGVYEKLGTNRILNFSDCRKSTNLIKQKIVYAANIHVKVLQYIINCVEVPQQQLALKLLHLCYYFIVSLIENHQQVKPKIAEYIPYFLRHLNKNVGCIDILKQLYDNNKNMLFNEGELFKLIHSICVQIDKEKQLFYKAKLLDFFRYLIYLNSNCLKNNQIKILKIMQDDDFSNILVNVDVSTIKSLVQQYQQVNGIIFQSNIVKCSPQIVYMSSYLQIITSLIDKNCNVNIGKLIKRFPFELLADCIIACQDCWILKRNFRAIINRMYYFQVGTNVYLNSILAKQIPSIIDDLDRFIQVKNKSADQGEKLQNIRYQNPVRFNYLQSHFYLNLEQNFFTLFSLLDTEQLYSLLSVRIKNQQGSKGLSLSLIKIAQRIGFVKKYFKSVQNIYVNAFMKFLQSRLVKLFEEFDIKQFKEGLNQQGLKQFNININLDKNNISEEQIQKRQNAKNYIVKKILNGQIASFYQNNSQDYKNRIPLVFFTPKLLEQQKNVKQKNQKRLTAKLREIFKRKKLAFKDKDEEINKKMSKIVQGLKMSKTVNRQFAAHFENLFTSSYKMNCKQSGQQLQQVFDYLKILIKINQEDPQCLSEQLKIFILRIVVSLFYDAIKQQPKQQKQQQVKKPQQQENMKKDENPKEQQLQKVQNQVQKVQKQQQQFQQIDKWQAQNWQSKQIVITNLQKRLIDCKLSSFLTSLIKGNICNNVQLANNILLCSIAYMLGGNKDTQNDIQTELNKDPENQLLINIKVLIYKLGGLIRKNIQEQNTANQEQSSISQYFINWTDNYDFYDQKLKYATRKNVSEPHYVDETIYSNTCIATYRRAFKFLQLLCQNNNIDNKQFIRYQKNKTQSIDFIQIATKQFRQMLKCFCLNISQIPIFILDFLLEVTQIPVTNNQQALIKSSFFQDCCELQKKVNKVSKAKDQSEQVKDKQLDKTKEAANQIFQKCVQIILSNFEGNNKVYFKNLDRKLDPSFLIKILNEKLSSLGIETKQNFDAYVQKLSEPKLNKQGKFQAQTVFDDKITQILQIIIIFLKLRDVVGQQSQIYISYQKEKQKRKSIDKQNNILDALENSLLHIEIADQTKCKLNLYFPNHPFFNSISRGLKDYIMSQVNRETHGSKIVSLLSYVSSIRQKITESYNFEKCQKISEQLMNQYYSKSSYISIFICIYMGLFYNVYIQYGQAQFTSTWPVVIVRFLLSLLQLNYCFLFIKTWYKLNIWVNPEGQSRQKQAPQQIIKATFQEVVQKEQDEKTYSYKIKKIISQKIDYLIGVVPYMGKVVQTIKKTKQQFLPEGDKPNVFGSGQFYKNLAYFVVSIIGTFFYPPIIFIHLIDIVCSNKVLANIFQAIRLVGYKLFLVSLLGVAFTIVFSSITFNNYVKDVYADAKDDSEMCSGPLSCILALFVSGAIGQTMEKFEIVRFSFDLIYGIFFGLLFGNIISTLMLDAFSQLDGKAQELDTDKSNYCYICNISREKLQKNGQKFEDHITKKHFLWNYIFYIIALQKKSQTDYTGMQYYISTKYNLPDEQMDVSWIPDGQQKKFEKEQFTSKMIEQLDKTEQTIQQSITGLQTKIDEFTSLVQSLNPK